MKGSSITYGAQFGASYLFHEQYSVYAGFRFNYVNNGYEGHLKDITVGMGGNMVPAAALINNPNFAQLQPLLSRFLAERALDCKQTGSGIAPILGFHYNWDELNIGVKYEFKTRLDLKNKTEINTTGIDDYNNGAIIPYDIPALFTLGASYEITPEFTLSAGYHHFFDSNAKMINDKQKYINGGINEFLAGAEYRINDMFLISCGTQFTRTGVTDDYQTDLSFSLNSYSVGFGGAINLSRRIRLNLAYFFTNYEDWTKKSADYGNISGRAALLGAQLPSVSGSDTFGRTNRAFGIGLDYRF
jgi:long-chain fatty acid transport protein